MKSKLTILILSSLFFLQGSCGKDENTCRVYKLPEATQSGENTIGCLIDDVVMVPGLGSLPGLWAAITKKFSYDEYTGEIKFVIRFYAYEKDYECGYSRRLLLFSANNIFSEGNVEGDEFSATIDIHPEYLGDLKTYRYRSSMTEISSSMEITKLDTEKNIISGTFSFEAYRGMPDDYDPDDKLNVTEGRFDFNYCPDGGAIEGYSND